MSTLYLRNVPDDVVARLDTLARRAGMSVSSFAVRELTAASSRADNPALLDELPNVEVAIKDVVAGLAADRASR